MPAPDGYLLRLFRVEDAAASLGSVPQAVAMGITVERADEAIAGYGGVHLYEGRHWVFFHLAPGTIGEALRRPAFLHRLVRRGLAAVDAAGIGPVHALCEEWRPRSREWLAALGFRPMTDAEKDDGIRSLEQSGDERQIAQSAWIRVQGGNAPR